MEEAKSMTTSLKEGVLRFLESRHTDLYKFWTGHQALPNASIQDHCDVIYSLFLIGAVCEVPAASIERFCSLAAKADLPGWKARQAGAGLSVHNCAYLFGSLNLLAPNPGDLYDLILAGRDKDLPSLIDPETSLPQFPAKWTHHAWRVSHWLGGVPSVLLSLERSGSKVASYFAGTAERTRNAVERLIDQETGLIRAYKSALLQKIFRTLYRIRHNPDLGELGGIAHILWIDHVLGRRYTASAALLQSSSELFNAHTPYMESVPYCLDFDIVQIVRTASQQLGVTNSRDIGRATDMMEHIERYFDAPDDHYILHKVPGALAAYHECSALAGSSSPLTLDGRPIDIIKQAYWL